MYCLKGVGDVDHIHKMCTVKNSDSEYKVNLYEVCKECQHVHLNILPFNKENVALFEAMFDHAYNECVEYFTANMHELEHK